MAVTKKTTKKSTNKASKTPVPAAGQSVMQRLRTAAKKRRAAIIGRSQAFLARRPHRSFRRSPRRDYVRSLKLPGYWAFTFIVRKMLWQHKKLFMWLASIYVVSTFLLVGMASQETYTQLGEVLRSTTGELFEGNMGEVGNAGILLVTGLMGAFNGPPTETQQIYTVILALFAWLVTVWLLRAILAGHTPRLRDGLYNSGAPVLPTLLVGIVFAIQLLPITLVSIGYSAAASSGLLDGGVEAMLFWFVALLLGSLSLYWITSTFFALVIVTLPGMYPMNAIKTAGDLVIGRRVRILLRFLWLAMTVVLSWVVIMLPVILFDTWLKGVLPMIEWVPVIPVVFVVMSVLTTLWTASYTYLLYRRIVDDDAAPA